MRFPFVLLLFLLVFIYSELALAAGSRAWVTDSRQDFESGDLENVVVSSRGELSLGYERSFLESPARMLWDGICTPQGELYFAAGDPTVLYRKEGEEFKVHLHSHSDAALTSLAYFDGTLYIGSIPDGKIYRLENKALTLAAKLPVPYVWCLAARGDSLFAGTGPGGLVWRLEAGEKAERYCHTGEFNCLSLAFDEEGQLLVGTSQEGLLIRVSEDGSKEVLHDFDEDEVKAIVPYQEGLLVAVNELRRKRSSTDIMGARETSEFAMLSRSLKERFGREGDEGSDRAESRENLLPGGRKTNLKGGAVYHLLPEGRVDEEWKNENEYVLDVAVDDEGVIWVATGPHGRVFSIERAALEYTQADVAQEQAMALIPSPNGSWLIPTANYGGVLSIGPDKATTGAYYSRVFDASFKSRWGRCHYDLEGPVKLATRSGNTREPDDTWSPWNDLGASPSSLVKSPPGRYIQYRALWADSGTRAALSKVALFYRTANQKPLLSSLDVKVPNFGRPAAKLKSYYKKQKEKGKGKEGSKGGSGKEEGTDDHGGIIGLDFPPIPNFSLGKNAASDSEGSPKGDSAPRGQVDLSWKARDPEGDVLSYRVFCQGEGEELWMELTDENDALSSASFTWKTETVADGRYRVKVTASDQQSNSPESALTEELISDYFLVDNSRPKVTIEDLDLEKARVNGRAEDDRSIISALYYSLDGEDFLPIFSSDSIFDFKREDFSFDLPALSPGPHVIAIKALDMAGNIGLARRGFVSKQ